MTRKPFTVLSLLGVAACTDASMTTAADVGARPAFGKTPVVCAPLPSGTSSLLINPNAVTIGVGAAGDLQVTNQAGVLVDDCNVKWTSADTRLATVNATGLVTALKAGGPIAVRATASTKPTLVGSAAVTISPIRVATVSVPSQPLLITQAATLIATMKGADGSTLTNRIVRWSSGQPVIATVDSVTGRVTGVASGTATITAISEGVRGTATVTISPVPVQTVTVAPSPASLLVSQTVQLAATAKDSVGGVLTGRTVSWTSVTPSVATITAQGLVTAVTPGTATLTATVEGKVGTATVTVSAVPVKTVLVNPASSSVLVGQSVQLTASAQDSVGGSLTGRPVTWASTAPSIASISSTGVVTALAVGSATLTATVEGVIGSATVTVALVPVRTVSVSPATRSLYIGETVQLTASAQDSIGGSLTGRPVTWSSASPSVATISTQGLVTAVAAGIATLTATVEGKTGSATVTVTPVPVQTVTVTPSTANVGIGQTLQLTASAQDSAGGSLTGRSVLWSSQSPAVATISPQGLVTAVALGTATITATVEGKIGSATITVTLPMASGKPLAVGDRSACALNTSGQVYCWGVLPMTPSTAPSGTPVLVSSPAALTSLVHGQSQSMVCGLSSAGAAYCAGSNNSGGTGLGSTSGTTATFTQTQTSARFTVLSAGGRHVCGLTQAGEAYCWGLNDKGQLGNGTTTNASVPTLIPGSGDLKFSSISAGTNHTCALTGSGKAYCWGDNGTGQLGDGTTTARSVPTAVQTTLVLGQIDAGTYDSCALTLSGVAYCWGANYSGSLGDGSPTYAQSNRPVAVNDADTFRSISAGSQFNCAMRTTGGVKCWGDNGRWQLGNTTMTLSQTPVAVNYSTTYTVIDAGQNSSCGVTASGTVGCWGANTYGQLGNGTLAQSNTPVQVPSTPTFASLSGGYGHTCGRTVSGTTSCWGNNVYGQVGASSTTPKYWDAPTTVSTSESFTSISTGYWHSCGLNGSGAAYCWGLFNAVPAFGTTPSLQASGKLYTQLVTGWDHACGLLSSGSAECWGRNNNGQIGDSTTSIRSSPVAVKGGYTFTRLFAGQHRSCGALANDEIYCWGNNDQSALGDGTSSQRLTPAKVSGTGASLTFTAMAFSNNHSCGIGANGTVYCWGSGSFNGTGASGMTPVAVSLPGTAVSIAAGAGHTCAVLASGAAYCWGSNAEGQVGRGSNTFSVTPTLVAGGLSWTSVAAGQYHSCGITTGGATYCWGDNTFAQLGQAIPIGIVSVTGGIAFAIP